MFLKVLFVLRLIIAIEIFTFEQRASFMIMFDVPVSLARFCEYMLIYRTLEQLVTAVPRNMLFEVSSRIGRITAIHELASKSNNSLMLEVNMSSQSCLEKSFK